MMIHAYEECYIEDAMNIMGEMFDYAVNCLNYDFDTFFSCFVSSFVATNFESGNPKFVAGTSGEDLALFVLKSIGVDTEYKTPVKKSLDDSVEFWVGRVMAYFQWTKNTSFREMSINGLVPSEIAKNYELNKTDLATFIIKINKIFEQSHFSKETRLAFYRKLCGFTQKQLSEKSGVSLRMIQLYEQRKNDISKASADVVINLAETLGCDVKELIR